MRYVCPQCGKEIPEDSDFCYGCGRKKDNSIRLDQSGRFVPPEENKCAACGAEMQRDDLFCPNCGERASRTQMVMFRPKMVKYGWIGLALALIPGALGFGFIPVINGIEMISIFGLGHFYFKKWKRGGMFLLFTAFFFYIKYIGDDSSFAISLILTITMMFVYILQLMEVFVLAFIPPKKAE
jgi:DNA-directed RNA polymerase subunit RPC12/RpoP